MTTTTILSDNGASSGSAGLKTTGGNDGTLVLQTTTTGGTATAAVTIDTSQNVTLNSTGALTVPSGTTAQRPGTPVVGQQRYNTTTGQFDVYAASGWVSLLNTTSTSNKVTASQMPTGSLLQVVQTNLNTTTTLVANGTPTNVSGLAATITPNFSTSKIYIILQIMYASTGTTYGGYFTRNGTAIGQGAAGSGQQQVQIGMALVTDLNQSNTFVGSYLDSPSSTSALTYQFVVNNDNGGTLYVNRSINDSANSTGKRAISTVTLMEIAG